MLYLDNLNQQYNNKILLLLILIMLILILLTILIIIWKNISGKYRINL